MGAAAEHWIVERIRALPGWDAHNANESRFNQPGFDVIAINTAGHQIRVSVKSVSTGGTRHDYGIGRSFARHPADIYAFVDLTGPSRGRCTWPGAGLSRSWPWSATASTRPTGAEPNHSIPGLPKLAEDYWRQWGPERPGTC
jgi:hypothetical protein